VAALYRVTADGKAERKITGLVVSNGLAWSADGRTMVHSDSRACWIDRWAFDPETGHISGRTRLRTLTNEEGRPDGAAMDCAGGYWSAGVSAGCLNRFSADGTLLDRIPMPVPQPTMPCFGGPDMRTLFVTSLSDGQSEEVRSRYPQSGGVFQTRVDVAGVPVSLFAD
jgi:sugar lactone lactonase YvrE